MGLQQAQRVQLQHQESLDQLLSDSICQPLQHRDDNDDAASGMSTALALRIEEQDRAVNELRRSCEGLGGLREHVEELQQAVIFNLASQHMHQGGAAGCDTP